MSRIALSLTIYWLAVMMLFIILGWPVGFIAFFAFAAGEQWRMFWVLSSR